MSKILLKYLLSYNIQLSSGRNDFTVISCCPGDSWNYSDIVESNVSSPNYNKYLIDEYIVKGILTVLTFDIGSVPYNPGGGGGGGTVTPGDPATMSTPIDSNIDHGQAGSGVYYAIAAPGFTYEWSITNGYIISGEGTNTISYSLGMEMLTCVIGCVVSQGGVSVSIHKNITIYPNVGTVYHTTETLAPGALTTFELDFGKEWLVSEIIASSPSRIRCYQSAAQRTADFARIAGATLEAGHGLLAEAVFTLGLLDITFQPLAYGVTPTNITYITINNTDTISATKTVQINLIVREP